MRTIGVIGGSGLYEIEGLTAIERVALDTPFGAPSDEYLTGHLGDARLVFLPRHGRGHRLAPHEINYRANIHGMKQLGVEWIISISAVGSMREEIRPGDIVICDQFFDRTRRLGGRASSFFGDGVVGHVGFADPVCHALADVLYAAAVPACADKNAREGSDGKAHKGGTYVVMEGPAFSTRAESRIYRSWGVDVIGMTNLPEAKLAREAEICFATVALSTDYDCWHDTEEDVSVEAVLAIVRSNVALARDITKRAALAIPAERGCHCPTAAQHAIMTDRSTIPPAARERLKLLYGKYLGN
jgi:5'-methylthioadenosine phosphorylase